MPILETKSNHSAILRNLLASTCGTVIGLFFGVPPAFGAHALGLPWLPYGTAVIIIGLVVGLLMAFTAEAFLPHTLASPAVSREPVSPAPRISAANLIRRRLAEEKAGLDRLDSQRQRQGDGGASRKAEDRIIWNELLDLELQDIDEQLTRARRQSPPV